MGSLPISSTPLQVILKFAQVDSRSTPTSHPLSGQSGSAVLYRSLLLQQVDSASHPALQKFLTTPLQQIFDEPWSSLNSSSDPSQRPATLISNAIKSTESRANAIQVNVPPTEKLMAIAGNVSIGIREIFPAQQPVHQLTLAYHLPGIASIFNVTTNSPFGSWADPRIKLTFDGRFMVEIAVPSNPEIPLGINTEFITDNVHSSADTFFSGVELTIRAIIKTISGSWSGSSGGGGIPGTQTPVPIPQLLRTMSNALTVAYRYGFTQLDVDVNANPLP